MIQPITVKMRRLLFATNGRIMRCIPTTKKMLPKTEYMLPQLLSLGNSIKADTIIKIPNTERSVPTIFILPLFTSLWLYSDIATAVSLIS